MSIINKSRTVMTNGHLNTEEEELLIPIKYLSKAEINEEKEHYQYEKLKHKLKKKITENIIDKIAKEVQENENKKDIHVFAALKTKSDSKGLYQRLKKIEKRKNEPHELKNCFYNWLYKTPNAIEKRKRNKISKNDRNNKIIHNFYYYQNKVVPNVTIKTTDMTTKRKNKSDIKKIHVKPRYKYNYSSNNSNVSYNKNEYATYDPNKGNIYIGKMNGDANYYRQKRYNNFGSLTIIQHNVDNTKKNLNNLRYVRDLEYTRTTNKSQERRNEFTVGTKTMRNSNSSSLIFMNSYGGSKPQKNEEMRETYETKRDPDIDREEKVWTVRKETYECKEVF